MRTTLREKGADERPPSSIERLRESVAIRVQATSLRAVAREVGMSPAVLEKFMRGGVPYMSGRRKLFEWWGRERGKEEEDELEPERLAAVMGAMVRDLPRERREPALGDLVRTLRALYQARDGGPPPWLAELTRRWLPSADDGAER